MSRSLDEIRTDVYRNSEEPYGSARSARAERLVTEAEATGDRPLLVEALTELTVAYTSNAEGDKMFVPFARLLRMWDQNPADFDEDDTHELFWMFKWVSGNALDQPGIPLDSIEQWLTEMRHRYRLAGHSERGVHSREFEVARHLGDLPRAERALAAMLASERDEMADCHACELHERGRWETERGEDARALDVWLPVLDGRAGCMHEPHAVLALSLLPLVRLGRLDEARAHHLRGYRMARAEAGLTVSVAAHVEFCALTGNEPRGLEILAEQSARWGPRGDAGPYLQWLSCAALLTGRLVTLGQGERPVSGPAGTQWTAASLHAYATQEALALAARFDTRNGNSLMSTRVRTRITAEPLLDALALGPGGERHTGGGLFESAASTDAADAYHRADGRTAPGVVEGPGELVARARALTAAGHPSARAAWDRARAAVEAHGGALAPADAADALDAEALDLQRSCAGGPEAAALFTRAADLHARARRDGRALVSRARALIVAPDAPADGLDALCVRAGALHAAGLATAAEAVTVLLLRCRAWVAGLGAELVPAGVGAGAGARAGVGAGAPEGAGEAGHGVAESSAGVPAADAQAPVGGIRAGVPTVPDSARAREEIHRLLAFAEEARVGRDRRGDPELLSRIASAVELLARITAPEDPRAAVRLATAAVTDHHEAGRPWLATPGELLLVSLLSAVEDHERAAAVARGVLGDSARVELLGPGDRARFCLALAQAVTGLEGPGPEAEALLLDADLFAGSAGEGAGLGALVRLRLGGHYCALGRFHEAAATLEAVLPELSAGHDPADLVQARVWLAHAATGLGEPRQAAEQYALAAAGTRDWADRHQHAVLSQQAAEALAAAGLPEESARAYERAADLWRALGDRIGAVRALRGRAWEALKVWGPAEGEVVMEEALRENERALALAGTGEERARGTAELGHTHQQFAHLLVETAEAAPFEEVDSAERYAELAALFERALGQAERAIAALRTGGEPGRSDLWLCELLAVRLEWGLGRADAAQGRARRVHAGVQDLPDPDGTLSVIAAECEALLGAPDSF
ncbi:tetratricopeptide repeat protein [Streptomyces sp. NBC_01268]|uniref:tetratricopeptide repeat protein n=1 Tax=Streptomyces sp. NBC_01268 TaxID=2903806 RepID=UPI002E367F0B|nr:tetratricopeptide repeat protein [Streptomyces sp. NBC_01268]